jgi:tyrosine-protein kinase
VTAFDEGFSAFGEPRSSEQGSLRRYLDTILEHRWFVTVSVVVCTLAATLYALTAPKVYEAHADMLITPVPDDQTAVLGLGLLRRAADPTRDVSTAARLIDNAEVAAVVQRDLRDLRVTPAPGSPQALLRKISVEPVADSSVVSITASTNSAAESRQLANLFGAAVVKVRTERLHRELDPAIANLSYQIKQITGRGTGAAPTAATQPLYAQLAAMESLRSGPDPTIRLETPATLPASPASPRTKLNIAGGLIAGLLIGIAGAFALRALDPRGAREGGLGVTGLSVLTRVPLLDGAGRRRPAFDESFRALRTAVRFAFADSPFSTLAVTSASEQEGKTTTSFQLAMATLEAGQSVLLVEADPFRPRLWSLVGTDAGESEDDRPGLLEYLSGTATLDDIIVKTNFPGLTFVRAGLRRLTSITGLLEGERGRSFVSDLAGLADVVILDCPPVGPRSDAILIASHADAVLMVVDVERSNQREVLETVRRLRRTDAHLLGLVVNRDKSPAQSYEYGEPPEKPRPLWRPLVRGR